MAFSHPEVVSFSTEPRVLLHICCGPCAVWPVQWLKEQGFLVEGFWYNPNIHPWREYQARLDSCRYLAQSLDIRLHERPTGGIRSFLGEVRPEESLRPYRCLKCYRLRLTATAAKARELGIDAITTTLLVSPYQDHDAICEIGRLVAHEYGLSLIDADWRSGFRGARSISRKMGLYHQKYCGCVYSEEERFAVVAKPGSPDIEG